MVFTPFSTPPWNGCYSFSKSSALPFAFQPTLHGALKMRGVFLGKRAAPITSNSSRSTLVLADDRRDGELDGAHPGGDSGLVLLVAASGGHPGVGVTLRHSARKATVGSIVLAFRAGK